MARHGPARQPSVPPRTLLGVAGAALFLFLLRRPPAAHHDTTAVHPAAVSHYVPLSPLCSLETWLRGLGMPCDDTTTGLVDTCCAFARVAALPPLGAVGGVVAQPEIPGDASLALQPQPRLGAATRPLWGLRHVAEHDAVFGLAFGYSVEEYRWFVGSLRKSGFAGDIVFATSKEPDMKPGVPAYLRSQRVLAYGFGYECGIQPAARSDAPGARQLLRTPGGCQGTDWYSEPGDPRSPRPLALVRYEHYKTCELNRNHCFGG